MGSSGDKTLMPAKRTRSIIDKIALLKGQAIQLISPRVDLNNMWQQDR